MDGEEIGGIRGQEVRKSDGEEIDEVGDWGDGS